MNFGNYNNMMPGGYYGGVMYQEGPKLAMTQGLTKEQISSLTKNSVFSLEISPEELLRSFCTHRHENKFAVATDEEGNLICSLCGTKFKPYAGDVSEAKELVNKVTDLMETTKMQALTLPPQTIKEFFQIEPMLKKLPDLFEKSKNDYKRALGVNDNYYYGAENNAFAMYQNIINPIAGNGYYDPAMMQQQTPMFGGQAPVQQPMYNQPMYNQPMMQQQTPMFGGQAPVQQPMYNQPMYNQPMMQQQGQNPFNVGSNPVVNQAQPQTAPVQEEQVTVNKTLQA